MYTLIWSYNFTVDNPFYIKLFFIRILYTYVCVFVYTCTFIFITFLYSVPLFLYYIVTVSSFVDNSASMFCSF